jgi:maltodextrin utilization protein YvdJ
MGERQFVIVCCRASPLSFLQVVALLLSSLLFALIFVVSTLATPVTAHHAARTAFPYFELSMGC